MKADGSAQTPVLQFDSNSAFAPAISPDGQTIAFRTSHNRGSVWVASTADPMNTAYPLLDTVGGNSDAPAWGPDGQTVMFTITVFGSTSDEVQLYKYNPVTGGTYLTASPTESKNPAWSR